MGMHVPAKIYPLTIPAGGVFPLLAVGSYFKVLSATGGFEVTGDTFGQLGSIQPGQGLRQGDGEPMFTRLVFRDTSGAANTLTVLVSGDGFVDDRVTGTVEVIDAAANRALSGQGFQIIQGCPAAAGFYSYVMIYAPAASKRLRIDALKVSSGVAGGVTGALVANPPGFGAGMTASNKLAGGPDGTAIAYTRNNTATDLLAGGKTAVYGDLLALTPLDFAFKYPIVLPGSAGIGLVLRPNAVNASLNVWAEMVEESA